MQNCTKFKGRVRGFLKSYLNPLIPGSNIYRARGVELKEQIAHTVYKPAHIIYIRGVYFVNYIRLQQVKETTSFGSHTITKPCGKILKNCLEFFGFSCLKIWYMIWYDMIWYDMIWYDMIWYDMIWYDMIWYYIIWYDMPYNWGKARKSSEYRYVIINITVYTQHFMKVVKSATCFGSVKQTSSAFVSSTSEKKSLVMVVLQSRNM